MDQLRNVESKSRNVRRKTGGVGGGNSGRLQGLRRNDSGQRQHRGLRAGLRARIPSGC